jgi:SAM-dependent methyltransferase
MNSNPVCGLCRSLELNFINGFQVLPLVTSDCRPWPSGASLSVCNACGAIQKLPTPAWLNETQEIYSNYNLWPLSEGREQPLFLGGGIVVPRSERLIQFLYENVNLSRQGKLLDIGCGTGDAMRNFSKVCPKWELNGADISAGYLDRLTEIPGFKRLYTGPMDAIDDEFDLLTMIHSLEHFPNPLETFNSVLALKRLEGSVLIEVPNVATNPFDLVIADHFFHFTPPHLEQLAINSGVTAAIVRDDVLPKEITLLIHAGESRELQPIESRASDWISYVNLCVKWLSELLLDARKHLERAKREGQQFGIFGTSISGMWLYGALDGHVDFLVDEDIHRQGNKWDGKTIYGPDAATPNSVVYLPLVPSIAAGIAKRLNSPKTMYIVPPSLNQTSDGRRKF